MDDSHVVREQWGGVVVLSAWHMSQPCMHAPHPIRARPGARGALGAWRCITTTSLLPTLDTNLISDYYHIWTYVL